MSEPSELSGWVVVKAKGSDYGRRENVERWLWESNTPLNSSLDQDTTVGLYFMLPYVLNQLHEAPELIGFGKKHIKCWVGPVRTLNIVPIWGVGSIAVKVQEFVPATLEIQRQFLYTTDHETYNKTRITSPTLPVAFRGYEDEVRKILHQHICTVHDVHLEQFLRRFGDTEDDPFVRKLLLLLFDCVSGRQEEFAPFSHLLILLYVLSRTATIPASENHQIDHLLSKV